MTSSAPSDSIETDELATRFLRVLESMNKIAKHRMPDKNTVGHLNLNQILTLHMLNRQPGLAQRDIADRLQITAAAVSNAMRELETLNLIERHSHEADARVMCVYLSRKGQKLVNKAMLMRRQSIADLLGALPLSEQQQIVESLERALAVREKALSAISDGDPHPSPSQ